MPQSKSGTHITPDRVYQIIFDTWHMKKEEMYDPSPAYTPYKAPIFFNGLYGNWQDVNYLNPHYDFLNQFVAKAIEQTKLNRATILLLPSKTEQKFFHDLLEWKDNIVWIRKRLKFKYRKYTAPQGHFLILIK